MKGESVKITSQDVFGGLCLIQETEQRQHATFLTAVWHQRRILLSLAFRIVLLEMKSKQELSMTFHWHLISPIITIFNTFVVG